MASTIQVRVEDEFLYTPMIEEELLAKLKKARKQGEFREANDVISDMRSKYGL